MICSPKLPTGSIVMIGQQDSRNTACSHCTVHTTPRHVLYTLQWRIQDFPEAGLEPSAGGGGRQHMILSNFPENCMKSKEFGCPGGRRASLTIPLSPPMHYTETWTGTGNGNRNRWDAYPFCRSRSRSWFRSRFRSRAVWTSH